MTTNTTAPIDLPPPDARRRLRELCGLTLKQVADACEVSLATVHRWEQIGPKGREPMGHNRVRYASHIAALRATLAVPSA